MAPSQTLASGVGYWAYFSASDDHAAVRDGQAGFSSQRGTYIMIGNPTFTPAVVRGADVVYVYDAVSGTYRQSDTLQPGQGAWAYSASSATVSILRSTGRVATRHTFTAATGARLVSSLSLGEPVAAQPGTRGPRPGTAQGRALRRLQLPAGAHLQRHLDLGRHEAGHGSSPRRARARAAGSRWHTTMRWARSCSSAGRVAADATGQVANFDETWTWNGATWTQQHPAVSPSPRYNAALAYDAARGVLVLFGGFGRGGVAGGYLNDTWTYDGQTWTPVCGTDSTPVCDPPPGLGNAMAYDPVHRQIVMFGGSNGDNYTWTWDGSGWSQQHPLQAPPAPQFGTMTFDPALKALVLVGSDLPSFGTAGNQVWAWDGSNWTQLNPSGNLPPRHDAAVAYDPNRGGVLLFGGAVSQNAVEADLYDTWVLHLT